MSHCILRLCDMLVRIMPTLAGAAGKIALAAPGSDYRCSQDEAGHETRRGAGVKFRRCEDELDATRTPAATGKAVGNILALLAHEARRDCAGDLFAEIHVPALTIQAFRRIEEPDR